MFGIFAAFDQDDVLFFQYPSMVSLRYDTAVMNQVARYQNATKIVIVEDFGSRIDPEHYPSLDAEVNLLNQADLLILQGNEMLEELKQHGLNGVHVILQKVWDYPLNEEPNENDVKVKDGFGILTGPNNLNPLYMGYYIRNNLQDVFTEDHRNDKRFSSWDKAYKKWADNLEDYRAQIKYNLDNGIYYQLDEE